MIAMPIFRQLIEEREYSVAAQMALTFLESVNVDDYWGKCIHTWPIAPASAVDEG